MSNRYEQSNDNEPSSLDRETLGRLLVRHPWAVRFAAVELALLSLAGVIPFFGEGAFYYVLFGMLLSAAVLAAVVTAAVGVARVLKRLRLELRHAAR